MLLGAFDAQCACNASDFHSGIYTCYRPTYQIIKIILSEDGNKTDKMFCLNIFYHFQSNPQQEKQFTDRSETQS